MIEKDVIKSPTKSSYKHLIAILVAAATIAPVIAGGGFWVGKTIAESHAVTTEEKLSSKIIELKQKVKLIKMQEYIDAKSNQQLKVSNENLQADLSHKIADISKINGQLYKENNCNFIHRQIIKTENDINSYNLMVALSGTANSNESKRQKILDDRIIEYQKQLSSCN